MESAEDCVLFGRFEPIEELGAGSCGRVMRCRDRETGGEVALKLLSGARPTALLSLKREFRALADVTHPKLVQLGELFEADGVWGFSMELVDGTDFVSYVRTEAQGRAFDERRLRSALVELAEALMALHAMGLVHRDVKPANVRVKRDGQVKLLDFGLVQALMREEAGDASGTVAYMAPEQARGERVGEAADWYALGVMLYEVLTHELPFEGAALDVLQRKQHDKPEAPSARNEGVPGDLEGICLGLLEPDVQARMSGARMVELLSPVSSSTPPSPPQIEPFVGRSDELARLHENLELALAGQIRMVLVEGESGMGKTTLVSQFIGEARARHRAVLGFFARCHPVEHVPFKMFDSIVDGLSGYLRSLDPRDARELLPSRAHALATLFPVLNRVASMRKAQPREEATRLERYELFTVFTELLANVSRYEPLVLAIDDVQWADPASFALLDVMLDAKPAQRTLIVATVRSIDSVEPHVRALFQALLARPSVTLLGLSRLADDEARELVLTTAGEKLDPVTLTRLCRTADGHPLFVTELARHLRVAQQVRDSAALDLDALLAKRSQEQDPLECHVLSLLAVAGAPLPRRVLERASEQPSDTLARSLLVLRRERLARFVSAGELSCYHDRMREAVMRSIAPAQVKALHLRLAEAWQHAREPDATAVARHLLEADRRGQAAPWVVRAARHASGGAAFEQAARLYEVRLAIVEAPLEEDELRALVIELADTLAAAGHYAKSARVLREELKRGAASHDRVALLSRAAQQLLQAGIVEEGVAAARAAADEAGLAWPSTGVGVVARLLIDRVALSTARRAPRVHDEASLAPRRRVQLELMWRLIQPLSWADLLRGTELMSRHLRAAYAAGSARHLELGLRGEATMAAMQRPESSHADRLMARADAVATSTSANDVLAYRAFARGQIALVRWQLHEAEEALIAAEREYGERCAGEAWRLTNVRTLLLCTWFTLGRFARLTAAANAWLGDAAQRGDQFALASFNLLGFGFMRHVVRNDLDAAAREIDVATAPWRGERLGAQHVGEALARHVVLAARGGDEAARYWKQAAPVLSRSFLMRIAFMRDSIEGDQVWATLCAAAAASGETRRTWLRSAKGLVRIPQTRSTPWARASSVLYQAEIALLENEPERALELARVAQQRFTDMGHFCARMVELFIARIEGGDDGRARERAVLCWLSDEGFAEPELWVKVWLPSAHALKHGP